MRRTQIGCCTLVQQIARVLLGALVSLEVVRLVEALTAAHAFKWLAVSVGELVPRERPQGWEAFATALVVADVRHYWRR